MSDKAKNGGYKGFSPDHVQEIQLGGHPTDPRTCVGCRAPPTHGWVAS